MKRLALVLVLALFLVFSGTAVAKEYKLKVTMWPQEEQTWCGLSVAQAWINWLGGNVSQQGLFARHAGSWDGVSADNLETILEKETGKSFEYHKHETRSSAFNRIKEEVKDQDRPLAISGNTCKPDGTPKRPQGHWMLIEALNLDKKGDFDGVYIKDPLYNSKFRNDYETLRPRTWVRDLFTKWWIPNKSKGKEFRQSVED